MQIGQCLQINVDENIAYPSNIQRSTSRFANQIAPLLHKLTSVNGLEHQRLTIKKLLKQPISKDVMPNVVINSKQYEIAY
jgi:hypothetical protein